MEKNLVVRRFLFNFAEFNKDKMIENENPVQYNGGAFVML